MPSNMTVLVLALVVAVVAIVKERGVAKQKGCFQCHPTMFVFLLYTSCLVIVPRCWVLVVISLASVIVNLRVPVDCALHPTN